jgi:hypothetical protein
MQGWIYTSTDNWDRLKELGKVGWEAYAAIYNGERVIHFLKHSGYKK